MTEPAPDRTLNQPATVGVDRHKLAAARLWATNRYPYLAAALFAAPVHPAPGLGRIVADRWWRIHADPEVVAERSVPEVAGELLHLTAHLLRDHAARADHVGFAEPAELHHWVDAADAEIADDFPGDLERVESAVTPADLDRPDHQLAEEYYRQGSVRYGSENDCGSASHGDSPSWEPPPPPDSSASGDENSDGDRPQSGIGEHEQQLLRRRVAADVAANDANAVPDGLRRWAADHLAPTVDWRSELAALIRRAVGTAAGMVDYSYRRPSRRSAASPGIVLPSLVNPEIEVAVVCDTSGSVSERMLGAAMAEVEGILRAVGTRTVRLLSCDEAVHTVERVGSASLLGAGIDLIGGGGTDMGVGLSAADEGRPRPALIVVLTDGYTPWPDESPRSPVVVALIPVDEEFGGALSSPPTPPDWCRTVAVGAEP